jgi:DNA-binding NtrC family response regulator
MCDQGRFRRDLFYRLNVFPIEVPRLSERAEDIPHLARLFLQKLDRDGYKGVQNIQPTVMEALRKYRWPGNIRELENLIERAYVIDRDHVLDADDFPEDVIGTIPLPAAQSHDPSLSLAVVRRRAVEISEIAYLRELLTRYKGKLTDTAKAAGITTRQLHKLMSKYGLRKEMYKS